MYKENDNPNREAIEKFKEMSSEELDKLIEEREKEINENPRLFNEQMSSNEARITLFRVVEGKSKAEIERIWAEYEKVLPAINERERKLSAEGWLF